jgi:hypothetical protein
VTPPQRLSAGSSVTQWEGDAREAEPRQRFAQY